MTVPRQGRVLWGLMLATALCGLGCSVERLDGPSRIERVTVLSADGTECLEGCSDAPLDEMRAALGARPEAAIAEWIRHQLQLKDLGHPGHWYKERKFGELWVEWSQSYCCLSKFKIHTEGAEFNYEQQPPWYWPDIYRGRLTMVDADGRRHWRRVIPLMDLPIYPFEVQGLLVYITSSLFPTDLALINAEDGGLVGLAPVPNPQSKSFWECPAPDVPFVWDRFVVVPCCSLSEEENGDGESDFIVDNVTIVELKLD